MNQMFAFNSISMASGAGSGSSSRRRKQICATWNNVEIACSSNYRFFDGRFYFPPESLNQQYLEATARKRFQNPVGETTFQDILTSGNRNRYAAWTFTKCRREFKDFEGWTAFWKGVTVAQAGQVGQVGQE